MNQNHILPQSGSLADIQQTDNEERFRQLIKNSFDMMVLIDADGMQHYVSESCKNILGFTPEELVNIPVIELMIHPDDRQKTMHGLQEIIKHKGVGGVRYRHRHKNGSWVYLEAFGTNQLDNPAVKAVVLNVRDVTERTCMEQALKENEARLAELNAAKDRFFSIIAHDLKAPFNSILGFSDLLVEQMQERNYEEIESYALGIKHSAQRTLDLLTNLLEWSRAQTGRMKFSPTEINLSDVVQDVRNLLEHSARIKGIVLYADLPASIPVFADKNMLATILRNLILNGIKFTHPGGSVKISTFRSGNTISVSVTDNGIGIPHHALEKLFKMEESFFTLGTYKEQGTGLGLLLCREFIERHSGTIEAESEEGSGSTFRFTLPISSGV